MSKRAETALKKSIRKWERIVAGTGLDDGHYNCALCGIYAKRTSMFGFTCSETCPIKRKTGKDACEGSPYEAWIEHQSEGWPSHHYPFRVQPDCPDCSHLAKAELDFLKGLLL